MYFYRAALPRRCNRPAELSQNVPVGGLHRAIAAAGGGFETSAIEYGDIAAAIAQQLLFLQQPCGVGDADAAHAQHLRKHVVGQMEVVGVRAIVGHQQPARHTSVQQMKTGAGGCARELGERHVDIAVALRTQRLT